jgi:mono/diheme cytochrome c family protein
VIAIAVLILSVAAYVPIKHFLRKKELAEQLALGKALYAQHCASCHGANLEGQPNWQKRNADGRMPAPPHDDSGHTWHHSDEQLFKITKLGVSAIVPGYESDMVGFAGKLSDADIRAIIAFIKSTWSQRSIEYQSQRNRLE